MTPSRQKRRIWYESDLNGEVGKIWEVDYSPNINLTYDHQRLYGGCTNDNSKAKYGCPVDSRHVTGLDTTAVGIELLGNEIRPFVPMFDHGYIVCSREFEALYRRTKLTGLAFGPVVNVDCDQTYPSLLTKTKGFTVVEFAGEGGVCDRIRLSDSPGKCPFCGYAPMLCSGCGNVNSPCIECNQITIDGKSDTDASCTYQFELPIGERAVSRQKWDGSDFFSVRGTWGSMFVSRAGRDFLEAHALNYFRFTPARISG